MVAADRIGRTGNEASSYGERWRVGLHFTQPNLQKALKVVPWGSEPISPDSSPTARQNPKNGEIVKHLKTNPLWQGENQGN